MLTKNTFHVIVITDQDLDGNNPYESVHFNSDGGQSKYFGFLASVFHTHVVYHVNKIYCMSLLFLLPLYACQRFFCCSHSKRQIMIIDTTFYLILMHSR